MTSTAVGLSADNRPARPEVVWPAWLVPAGAEVEWAALQAALRREVPPCRAEPELWFTPRVRPDDFAAHESAVEACGWCPILEQCRAYALAAGEVDGVWGGLTVAERKGRGSPR